MAAMIHAGSGRKRVQGTFCTPMWWLNSKLGTCVYPAAASVFMIYLLCTGSRLGASEAVADVRVRAWGVVLCASFSKLPFLGGTIQSDMLCEGVDV